MPTILECSFEKLLGSIPDWLPLEESSVTAEVCVLAVGFEDRTLAFIEHWVKTPGRKGVIVIAYKTNVTDNTPNLIRLRNILEQHHILCEEVEYNQRTVSALVAKSLGKFTGFSGVVVEISTMASFILYPVLRAIVDTLPQQELAISYTEAVNYYPEQDEWENFWTTLCTKDIVGKAEFFDQHYFQSTGAEHVFEAMSFVGKNPSELLGKLVMIPNFSFHRVFNMREHAFNTLNAERSDVQWIVGNPPNNNRNGWRAEALYKLCEQPKLCEYCCTLNYKDILAKLQAIWEEHYSKRSIHIATLGSKAQHLGTFLFLLMHPEVSLLVSEPREFVADRFSAGIGNMWFVDLGNIATLLKALTQWNNLQFVW